MLDKLWPLIKQPSTLRGIVSVLVALGIVSMSPDVINSTVQTILLIIAAGEGIKGTINIVRDENKSKQTNANTKAITELQSSVDTISELQSGKF